MPFDEPTSTQIDGVNVWWTDVGGPCMGGIVFRTGRADESLPITGISHMVEHLALAPLMYRGIDMNGHVDTLTTNFYANGTQEQVEAFLTEICGHLTRLPTDRLDRERRVIETEGRSRVGNFAGTASARFGARGFGVTDWFEIGPRYLGPDQISAWARERFTAAQAAAWLTRPPSPGLRFELGLGEQLAIPVPEPIPGLVVPSHVHADGPHFGLSFTATRSMPLRIAADLLSERALATIRGEHGLAYTKFFHEERIGAREVLVIVGHDATDESMPEAVRLFTDLAQRIADGEVTDAEVARTHASVMPWNASDPVRPAREAARMATASLFGRAPTTWKGLEEQGRSLTPERVSAAMTEGLAHGILVAPEGVTVPERFNRHPEPVRERPFVMGKVYVGWGGADRAEVVLGPATLSSLAWGDKAVMRFEEIEVALRRPAGTIVLIDRWGEHLTIEPTQLRRGRELVAELEALLPGPIIDVLPDVEGWFELQTIVESHDASAIQAVWREIDILANIRTAGERVLAIAIGTLAAQPGLIVVTGTRLLHIAADRMPPFVEFPREDILDIDTSIVLPGRKLAVVFTGGRVVQFDRIRPRTSGAELEFLLSPIQIPPPPDAAG